MNYFLKAIILGIIFLKWGISPQMARAESAAQIKMTESQIREQMLQITRELGVSCAECHDTGDFKFADIPKRKIAKEHMRLVFMLRDNGMNGRNGPEATCYMCHRGQLKYNYEDKEAEVKKIHLRKIER